MRHAWIFAGFLCACGPEASRDVVPPANGGGSDPEIFVGMLGVQTARWWEMGCPENVVSPSLVCRASEVPRHIVYLSTYYIDRTEVTQGEYGECLDAGVCSRPAANWDPVHLWRMPVTNVTWHQASAYCGFRGKRLPTEAEWERAASGDAMWLYPWGSAAPTCTSANYVECWPRGEAQAVQVMSFDEASQVGAFDLAGNVYEWVADWYSDSYYRQTSGDDVGMGWIDPTGPEDPALMLRGVRGGAYTSVAEGLFAFRRGGMYPGLGHDAVGFRCARDGLID
jgi:formylglycine-generating enzyme required for sulfatase activity